jgi:hypothetical protein
LIFPYASFLASLAPKRGSPVLCAGLTIPLIAYKTNPFARFKVLMVVNIKIVVFFDIMPSSFIDGHQRVIGT